MLQIKRDLSLNGQVLFRTPSEAPLGQNCDLLLQIFYLLYKLLILLSDNSGLFGKKLEIVILQKEQHDNGFFWKSIQFFFCQQLIFHIISIPQKAAENSIFIGFFEIFYNLFNCQGV